MFQTTGEDELVDPTLPSETLLWRLFNEDGVRVFEPHPLKAFCRCSEDRIITVIESFTPEEKAEMVEDDGKIRVTCEYCSRVYAIDPEVAGA
jgi:molecular chaperone Hsp33